jgi:hypothetical protein
VVTWGGLGRLRDLALPGVYPGGAEVVRRVASRKPRGSHEQAQIQAEG